MPRQGGAVAIAMASGGSGVGAAVEEQAQWWRSDGSSVVMLADGTMVASGGGSVSKLRGETGVGMASKFSL